jgi:hypothetical protein
LARARRQELGNLAREVGAARLVALLALAAGGALALGHLAAPSLMAPATATATPTGLEPRASLSPGASALELAFWATAAAASVSNFRIMELLLRRGDARALSGLPLPAGVILADRFAAASLEALAFSLLSALFFLPLAWHGGPWAAAACATLPAVGLLGATCVGFAIQGYSGDAEFARGQGAAYAGSGSLFLYGPGIALAFTMGITLLAKLGLGEALRVERFGRPTQLALGLALAASAASLAVGWRYLARSWRATVAGFREADFVGFNVEITYQESAFGQARLPERLTPEVARPLARALSLQYGRRHALTRYAYPLLWLGYGAAAWRFPADAFPLWAASAAPVVVLGLLFNPWTRHARLVPSGTAALPLSRADEDRAVAAAGVVEACLFALPCALAGLVAVGVVRGDWADAALLAGFVLVGCVGVGGASMFARSRQGSPWVMAAAGAGAIALLVGLSAGVAVWAGAAAALAAAALLSTLKTSDPSPRRIA